MPNDEQWQMSDKQRELLIEVIGAMVYALKSKRDYELNATIAEGIELSRQALSWPPGYFEETIGSLADDPIERGSQGEYEEREELD